MKFISTRSQAPAVGLIEALQRGLAPDGGLYVPEELPKVNLGDFAPNSSLPSLATKLLQPFFAGSSLAPALAEITASAFEFPVPLVELNKNTAVLELFHGPTAAFKDVGARFLAECLSRLPQTDARRRTILVATSGDTGGAVAGAFFERPGLDVFVLYPKGKISERQEKQIACWGGNVHAFAVNGTFDDCQAIAKDVLADGSKFPGRTFLSANSISLGRLLPQMIYYAKASVDYFAKHGERPGFIVPSGNLGNAVAALFAKRMEFPIKGLILATNANRSIGDFLSSGQYRPAATLATLANAMDVGNPSNMERLNRLYPDFESLKKDVQAVSVSDAEITEAIRTGEKLWSQVWCPHTATAAVARAQLSSGHWILVATAHPAKFETIVEPLIGRNLGVPPALAALLNRRPSSIEIEASTAAFVSAASRITSS